VDNFHYASCATNNFHCQQRWMWHKGDYWEVHEKCTVRTAVCQNALFRLKWCQTVKKNQAFSFSYSAGYSIDSTCLEVCTIYGLYTQSVSKKFRKKLNFIATLFRAIRKLVWAYFYLSIAALLFVILFCGPHILICASLSLFQTCFLRSCNMVINKLLVSYEILGFTIP